ncbi:hypothetical protein QYE76_031641 [Lolium multiflorum]|uniref:Transposase (putative) gypsy type domain-containing protein n=1 Tax=Lolium multiflorum TaxID=4521 RepID=A0AAD8VKM0_LOLMU|nr:hypothetical protein QYE76_031641 [Lolium multiflorum]
MAAKGWGKSKVTKEALIPHVVAGIIPEFKRERWRVPAADEVEPLPRPGEFVLFLSFLDRGLALPSSDFFRQLLSFYNIKVSDLGPHSVQQIALFVALCECYLGCPPYFPLWVSIFHGRATRVSKGDQSLIPNGGITFQVKSGENFIDMALPKKAQSQWRKYWFYALEYTPPGGVPIPQYTPEPSVPRRLNVRSLPKDQEEVVRGMRQAIQALKESGLTAANMYNCWLGRRLVPLRCRAHLMWEYKGQNDCTRSSATEWDEAEYRKALAKVTTAIFTSFDDGLQPFSEDKPAPKRWQTVADHLPPLAGKEPPEMTEGEDDEVEDEGDRTESDSEAREFVRLPRGAKRGASSLQSALGESAQEDDEGEESTSPPEKKEPAKKEGEPRPKRLRQTILEGATDLRRPLKDALDAGARVGPGVKAIPTVKSKRKVLTRPAPVAGAAATKAAEARKDTELKKAAEAKKASADPADLSSAREETVAESQAADATASPVKPVDGSYPLPSVGRAERVTADVTPDEAQDPIVVPSSTEEEPSAAAGSGSPAPMKERRTKAARDPARPSDPAAPTGGAPSTEAVMQEGGTHESRGPPLSTLSFTELHAALGEVHVAEVKRLTALVEEAAKKNRRLIALGRKGACRGSRGVCEGIPYREADFRAQQAEEAKKKAKAEVADLTKVLEGKGKELEDVIADYKVRLDAAAEARDAARGTAASLREELAALKLQHAKELAAEKETSEGTLLAVQAEKTSFEAFVREMSRQLLGQCDFVELATPRECLQEATTRIIACLGEILAALQYLSPREVIPRDAPSVFKAVSDIPAVVDWLRRSSCRVGVTMALSMVLAHYSEGFDVEEVTAGFPSDTGEFDVAEVLRLMEAVRPYADRVLATADLETHIASQSAPEDAEKVPGPQDFPAERLFHAAATKALSTYPVVRYTPKFRHGDGGAEPVMEGKSSSPK